MPVPELKLAWGRKGFWGGIFHVVDFGGDILFGLVGMGFLRGQILAVCGGSAGFSLEYIPIAARNSLTGVDGGAG